LWELQKPSNVELAIFDISGRKVFEMDFGTQQTGKHSYQFSANQMNLTDGLYTYSLMVDKQAISQKMIIKK
jgi:hypothetical protein